MKDQAQRNDGPKIVGETRRQNCFPEVRLDLYRILNANIGPRHHYAFELLALDTKIDVQPETDPFETRTAVMKAMQGHILSKAVYMGFFHRPQ